MKLTIRLLLLLFALAVPVSRSAAQAQTDQTAQHSIKTWLVLIDSGKYAESWQSAGQFFQSHVNKGQWQKALKATRLPLGNLESRKVKSTTDTKTLPGAPDGQYVVVQYNSSFEQKQMAVETVTAMLGKDGQWKVAGYYIK